MGVDGGRNETEVAKKWSSKQWRRKTKANFGFKRKILGKVLSIAAFQLLIPTHSLSVISSYLMLKNFLCT